MRQAGVLAAAGLHALDAHLPNLGNDHRRAKELAVALRVLGGGKAFEVRSGGTDALDMVSSV